MIHRDDLPATPDWHVTPHAPPEFLVDGLSAHDSSIPPNITLGEE